MTAPPPLQGLRVLEFAGLAPGPFAGLLLADYGATVLRLDRADHSAHTSHPPAPTPDNLTRRKRSLCIDLSHPRARALLRRLLEKADVLIDPFRPGVLEKHGLEPAKLIREVNPRLVVARMTGFRREGPYKDMAGHDINYLATSGLLSMLGRKGEKPYAPGNVLGDFAGGGLVCFVGILLALLARAASGKGQVVEANMVDGAAFLATFPRLAMQTPMWDRERGRNVLDGGCPWYDTYECKGGGFMSVGALEDKFWRELLKGVGVREADLPGSREDRDTWDKLRVWFENKFKERTRSEWERVFTGTDACVAPVLGFEELRDQGEVMRPLVTLRGTPGLAIGRGEGRVEEGQGDAVQGGGWMSRGLSPGVGGEEVLGEWLGWRKGKEYDVAKGGLVMTEAASKTKL